jgi:SAM-dependent methyltransferase
MMTDQSLSETETSGPATERYSQRDNRAFSDTMALRNASSEVSFFLAYLRPGMAVLDVGCGPGSITLGLAAVVAPAEVVGVDLEPAQVEQARARAAERSVANARFEVANVYDLPFPNGAFDAVLIHTVLIGLREPVRALRELRRVLRPGGVVGVRDPDWGADLLAPTTPLLEQWWNVRWRVLKHNGGEALGRLLRGQLLEAGFARADAQATVSSAGSLAETREYAGFLKAQLNGHARTAIAQGWLDQSTVDAIAEDFDRWAERPDAFSARIYCEAIGWVNS